MNEIYEDILRRLKRNAIIREACFIVFIMCIFVPLVIWQEVHEKGGKTLAGPPEMWLWLGAGAVLSAFFGVRAWRAHKALIAEKAVYEKNSFVTPQRARHLTRGQSRKLMQAARRAEEMKNVKVVYDPKTAAQDTFGVFHSYGAALGALIAVGVGAIVLVLVFLYAYLTYKTFTPTGGMAAAGLVAALGAVVLMCLRWHRLKKRGRIPRELQRRPAGWQRRAEAAVILLMVAGLAYFIAVYGFGRLWHDFLR